MKPTLALFLYFALLAGLLWPSPFVPGVTLLVAAAVASRAFAAEKSPFWRSLALTLLVVPCFLFLSRSFLLGPHPGSIDSRSWLVFAIAAIAVLQAPKALGSSSRAATSVAAAAGAVFLVPIQDVAFLSVSPPLLLQLVPIAAATLLSAIPIGRIPGSLRAVYQLLEPLFPLAAAWLFSLPFLTAAETAWPWLASHLLLTLGVPASLAALLSLGPRFPDAEPPGEP